PAQVYLVITRCPPPLALITQVSTEILQLIAKCELGRRDVQLNPLSRRPPGLLGCALARTLTMARTWVGTCWELPAPVPAGCQSGGCRLVHEEVPVSRA